MHVVSFTYSRSFSARTFLALLVLVGCVFFSADNTTAQKVNEGQIKAVFLYNLTHFVTWPEAVLERSSSFNIGIYGDGAFTAILNKTVEEETKAGKKIVVNKIRSISDITDVCRIVFVTGEAAKNWEKIKTKVEGLPILTVSDQKSFTRRGGMVSLVRQNNKIQIDVNYNVVQQAGLTMSAKLLRLAHIVE